MATTNGTRNALQSKKTSFGLLANGTSGAWELAVDESTSGNDRWFAQIDGPSISFYFEIDSVDIVRKMIRFFEPRRESSANGSTKRNSQLVIGKLKTAPVTLLRDDEYDDRFFFLVGPTDSLTVRFSVAGSDVKQIAEALRQVQEELDDQS